MAKARRRAGGKVAETVCNGGERMELILCSALDQALYTLTFERPWTNLLTGQLRGTAK